MPSDYGKKVITILLLIFAIVLTVFILNQGIELYQSSRSYVSDTVKPSVDCINYFYTIYELDTGSNIAFTIENLAYSKDIHNITIEAVTTEAIPLTLLIGTSLRVTTTLNASTNFSIYPHNCEIYKVTCIVETGRCA